MVEVAHQYYTINAAAYWGMGALWRERGSYLPLHQQVLGCWLLRNSLFVGGIDQDIACGLSLSQPEEELVHVEGELL